MNLFIRNYAVVPVMNVNGEHVGGIVGTLRSIKSYIRDNRPTRTIVVWDGEGGSLKRRGIYKEYKAGRKPRLNREYDFGETPVDGEKNMHRQLTSAKKYCGLLGVHQIEVDDIEADDVIGYLARHVYSDSEKIIVSSDKDFLQLVDSKTLVYSPTKKLYYTSDRITEEFQCLPENFIYMKALIGDGSDNVKGVKGLGVKTVAKLFPFLATEPVDLEFILNFCKQREDKKFQAVLQAADIVTQNVRLMQLTTPVVSPTSTRIVRQALEHRPDFVGSELKLSLIRDGIQLTDTDFFNVFKEHDIIARREGSTNGQ
jgi:DNA polymerase-1